MHNNGQRANRLRHQQELGLSCLMDYARYCFQTKQTRS
jgi:hypothetical protein